MMLAVLSLLALYQAPAFEQVTVAVIDTGVALNRKLPFCKKGHLDFTGTGSGDASDVLHGTNVAGLIAKPWNGTYCLVILKAIAPGVTDHGYIPALKEAYQKNYDIVNISLTGSKFIPEEKVIIKAMLAQKQIVITAAGNEGRDFDAFGCSIYPACLDPSIIVVGVLNKYNQGKVIDVFAEGVNQTAEGITLSGTSQATANVAGKMAAFLGRKMRGY